MAMTGFDENKDNATKSTKGSENRSDRSERRERRERRETEDKEKPAAGARASRLVSSTGVEVGRANRFVTHMREFLKEQESETTIVKEVDRTLGINIDDKYSFVVYGNVIGADLYWNLVVFEASSEPVARREKKSRRDRAANDQTPVFSWFTTSDAVNDKIIEAVETWVKTNIKVTGNVFYTEHLIIHASDDVEEPGFWQRVAYNSENANFVRANADEEWGAESLSEDSEIRTSLTFEPGRDHDVFGRVMRSDFQMSVTETFQNKSPNIIIADEGAKTLVEIDGYVNLRHDGNEDDLETYVPEIVITQVDTNQGNVQGGVIERLIMGLATAPFLLERDSWQAGFQDGVDDDKMVSGLLHGLNIDPDEFDDTGEYDENQEARLKLLKSVCHKAGDRKEKSEDIPVELALLVREGGPNYAMTKVFMDISDGNVDAMNYFCRMAERLLGIDDLSEVYDVRSPEDVVIGEVRVPIGVFQSNKGQRPLEDADTLFMCNRLKSNYPEELEDYFEANLPEGRDGAFNLVMSRNYAALQRATVNQTKLTGFGTKLYLNPGLFEAILDEMREKDCFDMEFDSNVNVTRTRSRRQGRRSSEGRGFVARRRRRGNDRSTGRTGYRSSRY